MASAASCSSAMQSGSHSRVVGTDDAGQTISAADSQQERAGEHAAAIRPPCRTVPAPFVRRGEFHCQHASAAVR